MSVHVTAWVWVQVVGDPEAKLVLLKLADQANDEGECWPSRRTIAEACETSVSTVKRRLSYLVDKRLLIVEERARVGGLQTSNLYRLPYRPDLVRPAGSPLNHRDPAGGPPTDPPAGPPTDPPGGSTVDRQEPSVEPSREPSVNLDAKYPAWEAEREARLAEIDERDVLEIKAENARLLAEMRKDLGL